MKKLKILLPMLAFIFAVGMAFATTDLKEQPEIQSFDYIQMDGNWEAVPEQTCPGTGYVCRVQFGTNGTPHDLYENKGDAVPKSSGSPDPIIL